MDSFPRLKTGAVTQYPAAKRIEHSTHVSRYVDGSEQRFPEWKGPVRQWVVALSVLSPEELVTLADFFSAQQGSARSFAFTDPWDGLEYLNCSLVDDTFEFHLLDEMSGSGSLIVRENTE